MSRFSRCFGSAEANERTGKEDNDAGGCDHGYKGGNSTNRMRLCSVNWTMSSTMTNVIWDTSGWIVTPWLMAVFANWSPAAA